ncbi:MAG: sigma-E factor negative regulatory protein [Agarilytica sp.]
MTEVSHSTLNESLSALVDGESNDLDLQRVLNALENEESPISGDLRGTWLRYHSISSTMKSGDSFDTSIDISASIRQALDADPSITPVKRFRIQAVANGFGKTAVAAAVTFGVVFGVQNFGTGALSQQEMAQSLEVANTAGLQAPQAAQVSLNQTSSGAVVPQGFELPPLTAQTVSTNSLVDPALAARNQVRPPVVTIPSGNVAVADEVFQQQLDRLMFKHAEQSVSSGAMGAMPFTRVSSLSDENEE